LYFASVEAKYNHIDVGENLRRENRDEIGSFCTLNKEKSSADEVRHPVLSAKGSRFRKTRPLCSGSLRGLDKLA